MGTESYLTTINKNYQRAKNRDSKKGRLQLEDGYKLNGSVYIHYDSANFKTKTNIAEIDTTIEKAYSDAALKMRSVASKNMGLTEEKAAELIDQIKQVISGKLGSSRTTAKIEKGSALASQERESLGDKSFAKIAAQARAAKEDLIFNAEQLADFNKELQGLIDQVSNIPPELMVKIAKQAEDAFKGATQKQIESTDNGYFQFTKGRKQIWYDDALKVLAPDFNLIPNSGKANTSLLRLITGYQRLMAIQAKGNLSEAGKEANHIIAKLSGLINAVGTSCQEVTIAKATTSAALLAKQEIKDFVEGRGYAKTAVKGITAGEGTVEYIDEDLPKFADEMSDMEKSFVSKSDVNIVFRKKGKTGGELDFNFGLNIKDYKQDNAGTISPTFLGSGNYKDYLIRSEVYKTELEYDLINSIAQRFSSARLKKSSSGKYTGYTNLKEENYLAIKNLIAAKSAFMSIAGLGNAKDTSYLVVFTNKVMTTYDLFTKMAKNEKNIGRLQLNIANEDVVMPYVSDFMQTPADEAQDAYMRSRKILDIAYANFKVSVKGSKMKF